MINSTVEVLYATY